MSISRPYLWARIPEGAREPWGEADLEDALTWYFEDATTLSEALRYRVWEGLQLGVHPEQLIPDTPFSLTPQVIGGSASTRE
jgi:hypothetical protein